MVLAAVRPKIVVLLLLNHCLCVYFLLLLFPVDAYGPPLIEPRHEISNNVVCVTSKLSDQPAHMRSLIRAFDSHLKIL